MAAEKESLMLNFVLSAVAMDLLTGGALAATGIHGAWMDITTELGIQAGTHIDYDTLMAGGGIEFFDSDTDPCLSTGGHYHPGGVCHYGPDYGLDSPPDLLPLSYVS